MGIKYSEALMGAYNGVTYDDIERFVDTECHDDYYRTLVLPSNCIYNSTHIAYLTTSGFEVKSIRRGYMTEDEDAGLAVRLTELAISDYKYLSDYATVGEVTEGNINVLINIQTEN